ncbi:MAG: hypothetical protein ACYC8T_03750, partial [Myxococcaceae bacterium]
MAASTSPWSWGALADRRGRAIGAGNGRLTRLDRNLFINRELSWLAFNERVLEDARNAALPLYERIKFLAISSANLDEFFMVRVAGFKQMIVSGVADTAADGMLPADQFAAIGERVHAMIAEAYRTWQKELLPLLAANGVAILARQETNPEQRAVMRTLFASSVFPALTPLAVDPVHPFPHL